MKQYILISVFFVTTIFTTNLYADSALFNILDVDENGYITLDETQENIEVRKKFGVLDINNDTQIDEQEFMLLRVDSSFKNLDQDQDQFVSYEEALVSPELEAQFITLDTDNDQKLDPQEYSKFIKQ